MKRLVTIALILSLLCPAAEAAAGLAREECQEIVSDLERLSNLNPAEVKDKAPEALERLREGETLTPYFIAYNIYAENLFNQGDIDRGRDAIEQMLVEAFGQDNVECRVIALRARGQFFYKLGLYDRAADNFRQAMELCPPYDSPGLENCFTWSSTLFWLVQSDLRTGRLQEADSLIGRMDGMMDWLDATGRPDRIGYKPVMILGLKAKIALRRGDTAAADSLLALCPPHMLPDVPRRAYIEYYVARMQRLVGEGRHAEALPLLDELIEIHRADYKPIAAEFIHQKGLSLAALGRYQESTQALNDYLELREQADEVAVAQQLDELSTRYSVEKLQHERDNMRRQFIIVLAVCVALAVIIALVVVNHKRVRQKNRNLARHISELTRLAREAQGAGDSGDDADHPSDEETLETGHRIVDFINASQCYLRPDCSRDTIKNGVGVNDRLLAKAIVAATGLSFVNYINQLRLNASIEMLEEMPEMTINDISTACGFGTVRQFQRIFKQRYDLSPSAYREARSSASPLDGNP